MNRGRAFVVVVGFLLGIHARAAPVGVCDEATLRAALAMGGQITFACDGTIFLSSALVVTQDLTLNASGRSVTISGGNSVRILEVTNGATLRLINLTLDRGFAQGTNGAPGQVGGKGAGGAILLALNTSLIATDCNFFNNRAVGGRGGDSNTVTGLPARPGGQAEGGAIFGSTNISFTNCTFLFNSAAGGAGGLSPDGTRESSGSGLGGSIYVAGGLLAAANSTFMSNSATAGGALYFAQRRGTVSNCWFVANATSFAGGAIYHDADFLLVTDSSFYGNATAGTPAIAGALRQGFGELVLQRSTFAGNTATGTVTSSSVIHSGSAVGGALVVVGGQATVSECTFVANSSRGGNAGLLSAGYARGGALYNQGQTIVRNSTFLQNVTQNGVGSVSSAQPAGGGALSSAVGELRIQYCTIVSNAANSLPLPARGGGVYLQNGIIQLENSILGHNRTDGAFGDNVYPATIGGGYNLSSDSTPVSPGTLNRLDPKLGPLMDNGGPVSTMALLPGSPAINAADPTSCVATDARGVPRPQNGRCDIGAFEQTFMSLQHTAGLDATVSYFGVPNESYTIEYSFDLKEWHDADPRLSGAGPVSWAFPGTSRSVFFRVRLEP
jgi:hypothetical protein